MRQAGLIILFLFACGEALSAQPVSQAYSVAGAHSHNDYEQERAFWQAYEAAFGSMEADVFLEEGELYVAHEKEEIRPERTFEALYLKPIAQVFARHGGRPFADSSRSFQLLVDLKTEALPTLEALLRQLRPHPDLFSPERNGLAVKVVISGNRPPPSDWAGYPALVFFDGRPSESYSPGALEKVGLISDSFRNYSTWKGEGPVPSAELERLRGVVQKAHSLGKPFRFWAVPDTPEAWKLMQELGVDYINTDRIEALAGWLSRQTP